MSGSDSPHSDHITNERVKLTATYINNLATAFAVSGFVVPLANKSLDTAGQFLLSVALLILSGGFYVIGLLVLGRIRP